MQRIKYLRFAAIHVSRAHLILLATYRICRRYRMRQYRKLSARRLPTAPQAMGRPSTSGMSEHFQPNHTNFVDVEDFWRSDEDCIHSVCGGLQTTGATWAEAK